MNEGDVVEVLRSCFHTVVVVAGPAMLAALITGLSIGLAQTLTQIQEMTLTSVPKIFVTLFVVMLFLPTSFGALRSFTEEIMHLIAAT